jgi:type VI secretion system protein VasJ
MLGKLIGRPQWSWTAFGKHPSARDYFQISLDRPLAQAFAQWIESGFDKTPESVRRNGICSWRFWSRGMKKGALVCGLGKSSGDGVGRPYPLMLLGEGGLDGWEKNWHLLPFVLAPVWDKMEYAASRRMDHLSRLEANLQRMEPPRSTWRKTFHEHADALAQIDGPELKKMIMAEVQTKARILESEQKLMISLGQSGSDDPHLLAGAWHQALKAHLGVVPSTVFMGGNLNQLMLVVYCRPLVADDFAELWSV